MATTPSSASGTSSPSSSGGAANLLAALAPAAAATAASSSSSSGPSSSSAPSSLESKYAKLASEYSKLRSQFGVVKKAVVEEQARAAELSESLRGRELAERKREAEMEALNFRNQQLTKRIQVLQEDIEAQEHRSKHGKKGGKASSSSSEAAAAASSMASSETLNSVIGQELQSKIDENAALHAKLSDVDRRYEDLVSSLQSRIKELESESRARAQKERAEDSRHRDLVSGLKAENAELARQVGALETEVVDHQDRITVLTVQLESASVGGENNSSSSSLAPKRSDSSSFLPLTADDARVQSVELLSQFGDCVTSLVAGFSDFHTYWEHRLKDVAAADDGPLWDDAARLSKLLLQNVKHLKPVEEAYQSVVSQALSSPSPVVLRGGFSDFASAFRSYASFAREAEALTASCLQYEAQRHSCPPSQRDFNEQLQSSLRSHNRVLSRAADYLKSVSSAEGDPEAAAEAVGNLSVCASQLAAQAAELSRTYANKAADEDALPTVTEQLRNTNKCVVAALEGVSQTTADLSRLLADNLPRIAVLIRCSGELAKSSAATADNSEEKEEEKKTENSTAAEEEEETEVLREAKKNLEEALSAMGDKVKELEQRREHWKLEFQLLQMKYEKLKGSDKAEEEKDEKDDPMRKKVSELLEDRLAADSKASALLLEYLSQRKRLRAAERRRAKAASELDESRRLVSQLREEVGSTASNYEGQLGLMSEHVANMNDRLTSQSDQIETLKYELANKGSKGKGLKWGK